MKNASYRGNLENRSCKRKKYLRYRKTYKEDGISEKNEE